MVHFQIAVLQIRVKVDHSLSCSAKVKK